MASDMTEERVQTPAYGVVFLILGVFTALEVGTSYLPQPYRIPLLALLAAIKAALVLLYFMHLKFDRRVFAAMFVIGLVVIIPLILALLFATPLNSLGLTPPGEPPPLGP